MEEKRLDLYRRVGRLTPSLAHTTVRVRTTRLATVKEIK